ncbi:MAG: choice-of-anchor Q domain-containing protein [Sumerlaeia bacterium]
MLFLIKSGEAALIHVPADVASIQEAVDLAVEGDEVIVAEGTYFENVKLRGRNIILRSESPDSWDCVRKTVIDGGGLGTVVTFDGGEEPDCILEGFTITGGTGTLVRSVSTVVVGGGVWGRKDIESSSTRATLRKCVIRDNEVIAPPGSKNIFTYGAGIYSFAGKIEGNIIVDNKSFGLIFGVVDEEIVYNAGFGGGVAYCHGLIIRNIIKNNWASDSGGGLYECRREIAYNRIEGNRAYRGAGVMDGRESAVIGNEIVGNRSDTIGGGIYINYNVVYNNVIYDNYALLGGGAVSCRGKFWNNTVYGNVGFGVNDFAWGSMKNCIIWGNTNSGTGEIQNVSALGLEPTACIIELWDGGGVGVVANNPLFQDPANGNFELQPGSPAIDAGTTTTLDRDFEGNPRPVRSVFFEDRGDGSAFDIGAYEFQEIVEPPHGLMAR